MILSEAQDLHFGRPSLCRALCTQQLNYHGKPQHDPVLIYLLFCLEEILYMPEVTQLAIELRFKPRLVKFQSSNCFHCLEEKATLDKRPS